MKVIIKFNRTKFEHFLKLNMDVEDMMTCVLGHTQSIFPPFPPPPPPAPLPAQVNKQVPYCM